MKITIPVRTKKILTFEENELLHIKVLIAGGEKKKKKVTLPPHRHPAKQQKYSSRFNHLCSWLL